MFESIGAFLEPAYPFIDQFNLWASKHHPEIIPDHLCYKCGSAKEFEDVRRLFEIEGSFLYQSFISGRRIAIIKLEQPILTRLGSLWFLELADQKPGATQQAGFDHIELYPTRTPLEQLVSSLNAKGMRLHRVVREHHMTFDLALENGFKIRLEPEALITKIKRDEMK